MPTHTPRLLTPEQRAALLGFPAELSERELARFSTFTETELAVIARHRRPENRLGFAVQLGLLHYPGRVPTDLAEMPQRVLAYMAAQVGVAPAVLAQYGERPTTRSEHLEEIRQVFGYQRCGWRQLHALGRVVLPLALESDRALPLVETALEWLRGAKIIVPGVTTIERLVWTVQRLAEQRLECWLVQPLSATHRAALDRLLHGDPDRRGRIRLSWLREPPEVASARSLRKVLERLIYLRGLALPAPDARLHPNRLRQLARRCAHYPPQPLTKFADRRRHALLAAYLPDLAMELTDQALDMFDKLLGELLRKGKRRQEQHFQGNAKALNTSLAVLTEASDAFLTARRDGLDPFTTVFAAVPETTLDATVQLAKQLVRPLDLDTRDLIERQYSSMRGALLALYDALEIRAVRGSDPALVALDYVRRLGRLGRRVTARRQTSAGEKLEAPLGHVTERWKQLVFLGRRRINPNFYELAAFEALRDGFRSGDLAVAGSRRYRDFEGYLLPKERWTQLRDAGKSRLVLADTADAYLDRRQRRIAELLGELQQQMGTLEGVTVDAAGELHLAALDPDVPPAVKALQRQIERRLPLMPLADVLNEVDLWTGWSRQLTHLTGGEAPLGERQQALVAAVMGLGMNYGLGKLARSTPFTYRQLAWVADWHLREETLSKALAALTNFVLRQPLARHWGDGTASSSDGMRVKVAVKAANAERNAAYFGPERGATMYSHTADIRLPFATKVISTNDREALHVIDALLSHETDLQIQEHSVDTNGYTTHVFALCTLFGFRFAPRIRDVLDQRLYTAAPLPEVDAPFAQLLKGRINARRLRANWDEVLRVAASIRHGAVSAALLMRKLAAYPRQNQIAQALHDVGQLEKTVFILELLLDPTLRRQLQRRLNNSEAVNSMARVVFAGQRGELRDRSLQDQVHRASCLHLLIAAIGAWTTPYMAEAITSLRAEGVEIPEEHLAHLSPLVWEHVNFLGQYIFEPATAQPLHQLRPLRGALEDDGEDEQEARPA